MNNFCEQITNPLLLSALEHSNYGYGDILRWHNQRPQFLCEEGRRTEENVQPPTGWHQGSVKRKVFKCFKTTHNVIKLFAEQKGMCYLHISMPASVISKVIKVLMQGLENESTYLPLGTAWHSWSAALNRSIVF